MANYRLAKGLEKLRDQVNAKWPKRSKVSDGWIGDTKHAARKSDHNPDKAGVVHALDITHDPAGGVDSYALAETLLKSRDPRISYIISNKRIASGRGGPKPWAWRPYTGANPHNHHVHVSIREDAADDVKEWRLDGYKATAPASTAPPQRRTLQEGMRGDDVKELQRLLGLQVDGVFGWRTKALVEAVQNRRRVVADGVVGPQTWSILLE